MSTPAELRVDRVSYCALLLAPSLRDKFDFSSPDQFDAWAEIAFKGAEAFVKKEEAMLLKMGVAK